MSAYDQQRICSIDSLEIDQEYSFNPPLPQAAITFLTKHASPRGGLQKPTHLRGVLEASGLFRGKLIHITRGQPDPDTDLGIFLRETMFMNPATGNIETARTSVTVKFSRLLANEGVAVNVKRIDSPVSDEE